MQIKSWIGVMIALAPSVAFADIAPPSPSDLSCPRGALGRVHRGEGRGFTTACEPSTCEADADCEDGRVCSTDVIGLCVEQVAGPDGEQVSSARRRGCEPNATCLNVDSNCERSRRCVAPDERSPPDVGEPPVDEPVTPEELDGPAQVEGARAEPGSDGCGCRVRPAQPAPLWALAVLGLALLPRR